MANTISNTFWKEEVGTQTPLVGITNPLNEGLSLKSFIPNLQVNEGGDFIQREVFQALPKGKRSHKLGQSMAEIFLARHIFLTICFSHTYVFSLCIQNGNLYGNMPFLL